VLAFVRSGLAPPASSPRRPTRRPEFKRWEEFYTHHREGPHFAFAATQFPPGEWWGIAGNRGVVLHIDNGEGRLALSVVGGPKIFDVRLSLPRGTGARSLVLSRGGKIVAGWKLTDPAEEGWLDHFIVSETYGEARVEETPFPLYGSSYRLADSAAEGVLAHLRRLVEEHPVLPPLHASDAPVDSRGLEQVPLRVIERITDTRPEWRFLLEEETEVPDANGAISRIMGQTWGPPGEGWIAIEFVICTSARAAERYMRSVVLSMAGPATPLDGIPGALVFDDWTVVLRQGAVYWQGEGSFAVVESLARLVVDEVQKAEPRRGG